MHAVQALKEFSKLGTKNLEFFCKCLEGGNANNQEKLCSESDK